MALYVFIDSGYGVSKLKNLDAVVAACQPYKTKDGQDFTKAIVKKALADGTLRLYSYSEEELEEAQSEGYVIGVDWEAKIDVFS